MGEAAEAALWAEQNGIDPSDMGPEDWMEFYDDCQPPDANDIAWDAKRLLKDILEWGDEESPPTPPELVQCLFPDFTDEQAKTIIDGLTLLAEQHEW